MFLSIFADGAGPEHDRNKAMMHVVGPEGHGHWGPVDRKYEEPEYDKQQFLKAVTGATSDIMKVMADYNDSCT